MIGIGTAAGVEASCEDLVAVVRGGSGLEVQTTGVAWGPGVQGSMVTTIGLLSGSSQVCLVSQNCVSSQFLP